MKKVSFPKIGILGGMGPAASAEIYKRMINYCQTQYHCAQDSDYPQIFVNSLTLEGFNEEGIVDLERVKEQLIRGIKQLSAWVDLIIIPCNTVHCFYDEMSQVSSVPILSILELSAQRIAKDNHKTIGLLSSASTRSMHIYDDVMTKYGISITHCTDIEQKLITEIIERVMGGRQTIHDSSLLLNVSRRLISSGATGILVGCTELPFAMTHMFEIKAYDTLQILAEGVIDVAKTSILTTSYRIL